jgi:hypothetical protein
VIANIENRLVFWNIFFSDNGKSGATDKQNDTKCPLHHAELADISSLTIEFSDDPFNKKDRNTDDQVEYSKKQCKYCA